MSQRNPMNERYTSEERTRHNAQVGRLGQAQGQGRRLGHREIGEEDARAAQGRGEGRRKAAAAKQREVERKYYKPDTPRYKRLRLIWWILLIAAIGCTTLSFVGQQSLPPQVAVVTLILAYVFIIAAFVLDFWKIKKERVAYQERMLALEEKNAKAEKQARRVQQAKQVKAKGSGKNQNRHAAQKKAGEADGDADAADAGESDEPPVKPARPRPVRQRPSVCRTVRRCKPRRRPPKRPKKLKKPSSTYRRGDLGRPFSSEVTPLGEERPRSPRTRGQLN